VLLERERDEYYVQLATAPCKTLGLSILGYLREEDSWCAVVFVQQEFISSVIRGKKGRIGQKISRCALRE